MKRGPATGALGLIYALTVLFLLLPLAVGVAYAFNTGMMGKQVTRFTGLTLAWFPAAWNDLSLRRAVWASLVSASWVAVLSLAVGAMLGHAMVRHPSVTVRRVLSGLSYALLIVPESVLGVSLLLFYAETGVPLGMATLVAGITPVEIAVVALIVRARLLTLDPAIEAAAADLGAGPLRVLWLIVLPQLAPALAAAGVMAWTFAFDNVVIASFLATPQVSTLAVYLYGSLHYGPSPAVFAAAAAVFGVTLVALCLCLVLLARARSLGKPARAL